jgi:adenine-specific DNA methylase
MNYPKRLIEVDLPIARISAHARREKSIRHGHISTLHIWWARRPLAACRAVICAALWPDPADSLCPASFRETARRLMRSWAADHGKLQGPESFARFLAISQKPETLDDDVALRQALLDFIADFANWDNSTVPAYLDTCRAITQAAHESFGGEPGSRPLVVDPFAGGGSIPLEALRVGADAFASDLNPVPVLLNKVVLEYVPRYGERLAEEVRKWGEWIKSEAEKELAEFFPRGADGAAPIAYFWARTIISDAPGLGEMPIEVPLLRSMWLAKKGKRKIALRWSRDKKGSIRTQQRVVRHTDGTEVTVSRPLMEIFQPDTDSRVEPGTSKGGSATCPITGFTTPVEGVRSQLVSRRGGASDARLFAVVVGATGEIGRGYRLAEQADEEAFLRARKEFERRLSSTIQKVVLPDGHINHLRGFFNIVLYGMERWGDLFSARQALVVTTFGRLVVEMKERTSLEPGLAAAVQTCLALAVDRLAEKLTSVARWDVTRENPQGTFGRQALPMVWDFCEVNPFSGAGGDWSTALDWVAKVLESNASMSGQSCGAGHAEQASATEHPLPDDSVAAVFTDPPYYAAVPYADLSDFFYSWLRQTAGDMHSKMLTEPLTPKAHELVSLSHRAAMYREKTGAWFEARMEKACNEARRVCEPGGMGVVVFANKETAGWEAMLSALVNSGWIITASWPIDTEMGSRLRAQNSAALASSVHLVCRPRENPDGSLRVNEIGDWRDVLAALPGRIHDWMPRLAAEGIVGADAIFACLGPALEIFSRYSSVEKSNGDVVPLREYLEHVWAAVSNEALSMIFKDADAAGLEPDARLTAMWLWTLGTAAPSRNGSPSEDAGDDSEEDEDSAGSTAKDGGFVLEFDAARKIAQGLGIHLEKSPNVVEVRGDKARLLSASERTKYLFGKEAADAPAGKRKPKKKDTQLSLFEALKEADADTSAETPELKAPKPGSTVLDRVHQAMILFAAGRGEALKRFLVEEGIGKDGRFWKLAQSLSALYPPGIDEKRWVDGVLARKKSLGL